VSEDGVDPVLTSQVEALLADLPLPPSTGLQDAHRILIGSEYVREALARDDVLRASFAEEATWLVDPEQLDASLTGALENAQGDEAVIMRELRVVRRRMLCAIAWRDLSGLASVERTLSELSVVADALIEAALRAAENTEQARAGVPRRTDGTQQRLVVLGLGKLGSFELNFSSDIDLIFAFPEAGATDHPERSLENEAFFLRVARRFIRLLSEATEDGIVYRVDMRLRPFGSGGALVASFDQLEEYYQNYGRDWERFAFIRARVVAGDQGPGEEFLERLRPFVYRRYLDFAALTSLREIKQSIAHDLRGKRNDPDEGDIKRGWGGIRELEFIVQAFQLLRGASFPELQGGPILTLLPELDRLGLIAPDVCRRLETAYRFLRRLENCLQAVRDEQTHTLPSVASQRARIATLLEFSGWGHLEGVLNGHRREVRVQFELVLGAPEETSDVAQALSPFASAWRAAAEPDAVSQVLHEGGIKNSAVLGERLANLHGNYRVGMLGERAQRQLGELVALVLDEVVSQNGSEETVIRVLTIIEGILQRTAYLALLTERPVACRQLVRLCAASPWLAQHLANHPQTFDELLDPRTLYAPPEREELVTLLNRRLRSVPAQDPELEPDVLRYFQQANVLRVAAAEIADAIPLMIVSDRLTDIAETCVDKVRELAWRDMVARYGQPRCVIDGAWTVAPFGIVAYGKLGGVELSYGSDLDLVFLHGSRGAEQMTDGERCVDNATFFARLGQRIIHYLSTYTAAGRLYEVDSRLRPNGAAGLLVTGIDAFADYQANAAWTWEHQALVRARYISGEASLGAQFERIRHDVLLAPRDAVALRAEVREMRGRMRAELGSGSEETFHLKQDPGGIADIEFLVQYGVLRWASSMGESLVYTDNVRLLEGIGSCGGTTAEQAAYLADAYRAYRTRVHELDLEASPPSVGSDEFVDTRAQVRALWHEWMDEQ